MEKNYVVYQHVTPDGMYYFGQSQNVERRWSNNGAGYKGTTLYPYIEKYGWDNIQHIVLFRDKTKEDALWIEDFLIETAREDGVCINKQRSGLISKEEDYKQQYYETNKDKIKQYYENNKGQILEQQKQYYENNKDKIKAQSKQYYEDNKDKIKQYRVDNKDKIKAQSKQYYEDNKDKKKKYYEDNKDKIKAQSKQYREDNKDKIKQYYEDNKDKRLEYQRQYRQRKKLEKQLKELGYIPLF